MTTEEKKPSRASLKSEEREKEKKPKKRRGKRRERVRLIPIWLRIVIIVILLVASTAVGAMVGYGVIGDGVPRDVLKVETWQHVLNILQGVER